MTYVRVCYVAMHGSINKAHNIRIQRQCRCFHFYFHSQLPVVESENKCTRVFSKVVINVAHGWEAGRSPSVTELLESLVARNCLCNRAVCCGP